MTQSLPRPQSIDTLIAERYRLREELREETLGKVYRAEDTRDSQRKLALVRLKSLLTRLPTATQQRLQEAAEEARKINIDTLLKVYEFNLANLYVVTTLVDGKTLREWLQTTPQDQAPDEIVNLATALARAADYPRQQNFKWIRPSLDPDKIYVQPVQSTLGALPILGDLGFAALLPDLTTVATGVPFDGPGVVQQLGLLLLGLLLGDLTPRNDNWHEPVVVDERINEVWERYPELPNRLRGVLRKALNGDPALRYANPGELADALQPFVKQLVRRTAEPPPSSVIDSTTRRPSPQNGKSDQTAPTSTPTPSVSPTQAQFQLKIYDDLENQRQGKDEVRYVELKGSVVTAGLSDKDQVYLPRLAAQRLYFVRPKGRIGEYQYTVTDTGNGAIGNREFAELDGVPLSPYYAALFPENSILKVGNYRLQLVPTLVAVTSKAPQQAPPLQIQNQALVGQPGERLSITVNIQNQTREVDRFWLVLDGAPTEWQISLPKPKQLFNDETAELLITLRLPVVQRSIARIYPLILRLISENLTAQIAATTLQIELLPAYDYLGGLSPENLRTGHVGTVFLENHGNLSRIFQIRWRDRENELVFDPSETTMTVRPGEVGEVAYRAYARQWRWFGGKKLHTISVLTTPQNGGVPQTYGGQVTSRALIPAWAPLLVLLLIMGVILFSTFFLTPDFASKTIQPHGVAVAGDPFTLYWTPLNTCFASIYEDGNVRESFRWQPGRGIYRALDTKPDSVIEVRLRNCLFMAEKSWPIKVVAPTATAIPAPQIISFTLTTSPTISAPFHLLLGQTGDLCAQWEVNGVFTALELDPPIEALSKLQTKQTYKQCVPIVKAFDQEQPSKDYNLLVKYGNEQQVESAPVRLHIDRARCYVNTNESIGLYEGPDRTFPVRGYLKYDTQLLILGKPFAPFKDFAQNNQEKWVEVALEGDPRPGWIVFSYLYCPQNIDVLPDVNAIPPTPLPTPTETPTVTPTPTPTATPPPPPTVSITPEIINQGGCAKLKWEIQNVKEVYLNGEGVIGVSEREVCPTETGRISYKWRIVQNDGSSMEIEKQLLVNPGSGSNGALTPPAP